MFKFVIGVVFIAVAAVGYSHGKDALDAENAKWDAEHACMQKEVSLGTPRNRIVMEGGTCYVK